MTKLKKIGLIVLAVLVIAVCVLAVIVTWYCRPTLESAH